MGTFQGRRRLDRSTRWRGIGNERELRIVQAFPHSKSYRQRRARGQCGAFSPVSGVEGEAAFGAVRFVSKRPRLTCERLIMVGVVAFVPRLKPCAYTYQLGISDGEARAQQK